MCSIHCVGPCYPSIYSMRMSEFNLQQMIKKSAPPFAQSMWCATHGRRSDAGVIIHYYH